MWHLYNSFFLIHLYSPWLFTHFSPRSSWRVYHFLPPSDLECEGAASPYSLAQTVPLNQTHWYFDLRSHFRQISASLSGRFPPLFLHFSFYLPLKRDKATSDPVWDTVVFTHHCQRASDDSAFLFAAADGLKGSRRIA